MTRINCVPVEELTNKHLLAEYRELPRIYGLVRKRVALGNVPSQIKKPSEYTLGTGHVTFFYDKLNWLTERYKSLCNEMRKRGYTVNYGNTDELTHGIPREWFGTFTVTDHALEINRKRIADRLAKKD